MTDFLSPSQYFHEVKSRPRKRFGQHFLAQQATAARKGKKDARKAPRKLYVRWFSGLAAFVAFYRFYHHLEINKLRVFNTLWL